MIHIKREIYIMTLICHVIKATNASSMQLFKMGWVGLATFLNKTDMRACKYPSIW